MNTAAYNAGRSNFKLHTRRMLVAVSRDDHVAADKYLIKMRKEVHFLIENSLREEGVNPIHGGNIRSVVDLMAFEEGWYQIANNLGAEYLEVFFLSIERNYS